MPSKNEINFGSRVVSSFVKENKDKGDSIIVTKFVGEAVNGMFKKFSKQLDDTVFATTCWSNIKTGEIEGVWIMHLRDSRKDEEFAAIKNCTIKDIAIKTTDENKLEATITVQHEHTRQQSSLEAAVSTNVILYLEKDETVLEGVDDEEQKEKSGK